MMTGSRCSWACVRCVTKAAFFWRKAPVSDAQQLIRVGHSPDPDDAFMFYALARDLVETGRYRFEHELVDIETLNRRAFSGEL